MDILKKHRKSISLIILAACVLIAWGYMCYLVRDTVLACHDSMMEFINARVNGWQQGYSYGMEYSLARGKVGFIFPAVIMFRFFVNGSGNYLAIWLLQYVPVFANIALIGSLFAKKINKAAGLFFALFFFSFLQMDIWHCLITCYPLDFMYGLFLMISGLWLYADHFEAEGRKRIVKLVISVICFYESMQVYEAFIVGSLVYAVIAFAYARRDRSGLSGFIKNLIPHFITAVLYLGILLYLRAHPVVDTAVPAIGESPDIKRIAKTAFEFSTGMFPMKDLRIMPSVKELFLPWNISKKAAGVGLAGGLGTFIAAVLSGAEYRAGDDTARKSIMKRLTVIGISGALIGATYALPHSLIPSYQNWVIEGAAGGYLPTTICYFGWAVALVALFLICVNFISSIKVLRAMFAIGAAATVTCCAYITVNINNSFRSIDSFSGTVMSVKYRTFYDMITEDGIRDMGITYFYMPAYNGVHSNIETDESLADLEFGYDVELINSIEGNEMLLQDNDAAYMIFDADAHAGLLIRVDDYTVSGDKWMTSSPIYVFSAEDEDLILILVDQKGVTSEIPVHVEGGRGTYVEHPTPVSAYTIDIGFAG